MSASVGLNGNCLRFSPQLAGRIGLNAAIILQQLDYWIGKCKEGNRQSHHHDGDWWVYNTIEQWQQGNFPF